MRDRRIRWPAAWLAAVALTALAAPWLPLRDPNAQPDGLVLRHLPPLAAVDGVALAGGGVQPVHEIRARADGGIDVRRGGRWTRLSAGELAGPAPEDWRRRTRYLLGTDPYGRDVLSRLVWGARVSLSVGLIAGLLAVIGGGAVGLVAGLLGGIVDAGLMRLTDLALSVPRLFLVLLLVALYRPSLTTTIVVLAATGWMAAARLVRGEVLSLRERDWVQAARCSGAPGWRVALVHVAPAALAPLLVESAFRVGHAILIEASLSFLGLGVAPPDPSWGSIIADGRDRLVDAWWVSTFPGLAIAATVVALSVLGDGLRDRFEPRRARAPRETAGRDRPAAPRPAPAAERPAA